MRPAWAKHILAEARSLTTLDQMAKAAYEAAGDRSWARHEVEMEDRVHWDALPEYDREDWRAAIRAALAAVPPNAEASLSYESKPEPAEVKPDAVTEKGPL